MTEQESRLKIVEISKTWLGTPFHMNGKVKSAGVDCATFLSETFTEAGLIAHIDAGTYKSDFHLHRSEEIYLEWINKYCHKIDLSEAQPADILLFRFGRIVSHAVLVVNFPKLIHVDTECSYINFDHPWLKERFHSCWCFNFDINTKEEYSI